MTTTTTTMTDPPANIEYKYVYLNYIINSPNNNATLLLKQPVTTVPQQFSPTSTTSTADQHLQQHEEPSPLSAITDFHDSQNDNAPPQPPQTDNNHFLTTDATICVQQQEYHASNDTSMNNDLQNNDDEDSEQELTNLAWLTDINQNLANWPTNIVVDDYGMDDVSTDVNNGNIIIPISDKNLTEERFHKFLIQVKS